MMDNFHIVIKNRRLQVICQQNWQQITIIFEDHTQQLVIKQLVLEKTKKIPEFLIFVELLLLNFIRNLNSLLDEH